MSWDRRRRSSWVGATILIAVGVIGLLSNFDLLPEHILQQFWKLWPLIPLAIGLAFWPVGAIMVTTSRARASTKAGIAAS